MKNKNLTASGLLFEAARLVEEEYEKNEDFFACCDAINYTAVHNDVRVDVYWAARDYFAAMFEPKKYCVFWFGELNYSSNAQRRILALYFAAHAAYSDGL